MNKLDGRTYFGVSHACAHRWRKHIEAAGRGVSYPLYQAFRDLGVDAFRFEIVEWHANRGAAFERERELIAEHRTQTPAGYNQGPGGFGGDGGFAKKRRARARLAEMGIVTEEQIAAHRRKVRTAQEMARRSRPGGRELHNERERRRKERATPEERAKMKAYLREYDRRRREARK